jgi:hypothetical protein
MSFESLAYRYKFNIPDFPQRWMPLIHLYDPDLPLFPIYYFHILSPEIEEGTIPRDNQRIFGYVESASISESGGIDATVVLNKDLNDSRYQSYTAAVKKVVRERFGINNPVVHDDVKNAFTGPLAHANDVLDKIWQRVVLNAYDDKLPFGKLWDEVLGLVRFVASWNSPGGRKGELIQTHYFASKFGVRIQTSGEIPPVDFYLLPTITELMDINNHLTSFSDFSRLVEASATFCQKNCSLLDIGGLQLSKFNNPALGRIWNQGTERKFTSKELLAIINSLPHDLRTYAMECYNSFDKGPQRSVIFFMLLNDLRKGRLAPHTLSSSQCGYIYDGLKGSYQSPKAIEIYAQQCFGNVNAVPVDTWIETFFKWPLDIYPDDRKKDKFSYIFSNSNMLGKVERLIWFASQARKVHSSACNDALWCLKFSSNEKPRGANPLSCKICLRNIRNSCPAFKKIKGMTIHFNSNRNPAKNEFIITTSRGNNHDFGQTFEKCIGFKIEDTFSSKDVPSGFATFPAHNISESPITVEAFVDIY